MKASASDERVVNELESILKKSKGVISPSDASTATGYPISQVKDALARLIEIYEARVNMNKETGQVQFLFKYPMFKRGKKTFKEIALKVLDVLWKIFQIVYKASIGVVLVLYTVIFVIILIIISLSGRSNDSDSDFGIGDLLGGLFRGLMDAFTFSYIMGGFNYEVDNDGNRYKVPKKEKNKGTGFIKSVFSFVFGPDREQYDPLDDAKEAAAFIRRNNGKITTGNIVALTGVHFEEAEARLAEYAARFNGDLSINEDGVIIAEFYDMLNKAAKEFDGGKIIFYEDEVEAPYLVTGNNGGRNAVIIGMNSFNLIMAGMMMSFFSSSYDVYNEPTMREIIFSKIHEYSWLVFGLGWFPLVFSVLFFLIPISRTFIVNSQNSKREYNILRKKLLGAFIRHQGKEITLDGIIYNANIKKEEINKIKIILEKLILELKGELSIDSNGEAVYSFPRLSRELGIK
jgi:hypothetical protein